MSGPFIVLHSVDPVGPVVIDPASILTVCPVGDGRPGAVVSVTTRQMFVVSETVEEIIELLRLQAVAQ